MKYMFVSDIHGNVEILLEFLEVMKNENIDKMVILGDTAASMNEDRNKEIAAIINQNKNKIIIIRGNCDTRDFEENLGFEIFDVDKLYVSGKVITIAHGHYYNCYNLPYNCGDIFIQGHTHIPMLVEQNGKIFANPGSASRPRGANLKCYILIADGKIELKTIEGSCIKEISLS